MILSSLQNCVVSRLLIDSRPKGGHANQTGNCWIASGDSKTPPTFSSQGRVLTRGTTLVQPAVARRPSQPPTRLRSVTRPAVPPYFAVQADCSGASNPQRIPHRLAPTAGSLSGKGLSFSPSLHLLGGYSSGERRVCQEENLRGRGGCGIMAPEFGAGGMFHENKRTAGRHILRQHYGLQ